MGHDFADGDLLEMVYGFYGWLRVYHIVVLLQKLDCTLYKKLPLSLELENTVTILGVGSTPFSVKPIDLFLQVWCRRYILSST